MNAHLNPANLEADMTGDERGLAMQSSADTISGQTAVMPASMDLRQNRRRFLKSVLYGTAATSLTASKEAQATMTFWSRMEPQSEISGNSLVANVFASTLYAGNTTARNIVTGIDCSANGSLIWIKTRNATSGHRLFDTTRGITQYLDTTTSTAQVAQAGSLTSFNSNGFSLGTSADTNGGANFVAWTFRKAPRFFDVKSWSGSGAVTTQTHDLGVTPGMIVVKGHDGGDWFVYHSVLGASTYAMLNSNAVPVASATIWNATDPTSTQFTVGSSLSAAGSNYTAYIFADDPSAGGIIRCGSYIGNATSNGPTINLGWRPQYLMIRRANSALGNWFVLDATRGMDASTDPYIQPNVTNAEASLAMIIRNATGFQVNTNQTTLNGSGNLYMYLAIREP
jgi:hypothetical protein